MSDPVFFRFRRALPPTLADVIGWSNADADPAVDLSVQIHSIAAIGEAGAGALTFAASPADRAALPSTRAAACFLGPDDARHLPAATAALVTATPYSDFALTAAKLFPEALRPLSVFASTGISPGVSIHPDARLEPDVVVDPGAVIGARAEIGSGTLVGANAVIGPDVRIGRGCAIGPLASVIMALLGDRVAIGSGARIGGAGMAFARTRDGVLLKLPQVGRVILQDDVEIGANAVIDRGGDSDTVVGEGTKIGALTALAADARIGRHCRIAAQARIAARTDLADFSQLEG